MDRYATDTLPSPEELAETIGHRFSELDLEARLGRIRGEARGRIVFTTSLGIEDQVLTDAIFTADLDIDVVTLDTGLLFPETYKLWAETERRYGRRIRPYYPRHEALEDLVESQGIHGFYESLQARKACCFARKVEPLERALAGATVWLTGLRGGQSANRSGLGFVEVDGVRGLVKANPLVDWSKERLVAHVADRNIPYNPLHDQGFPSIGCQPCTRAIRLGEAERAGRWWWEQEDRKECGLHVGADGRLTRAA